MPPNFRRFLPFILIAAVTAQSCLILKSGSGVTCPAPAK
jgi:hypothetical protein